MRIMNIVMLGPPGAGKGTQAVRLAERLGIPHISTGDIFRAAIKEGTPLGKTIEALIAAGNLVPDETTDEVVRERLARNDAQSGWILDGYPRTLAQARALEATGASVTAVVNIAVSDEVLVNRLSSRRVCADCKAITRVSGESDVACAACGGTLVRRADDAPEAVRNRLTVYHQMTAPLEVWYHGKGLLHTIDGYRDMDDVTSAIMVSLESCL